MSTELQEARAFIEAHGITGFDDATLQAALSAAQVMDEPIVQRVQLSIETTLKPCADTVSPMQLPVQLATGWLPYHGPRGCEGYRDPTTGRIIYTHDAAPQERASHAPEGSGVVQHAQSLLEKAKQLPRRAVLKVMDKAHDQFMDWEKKFGRKGALTILGAGLLLTAAAPMVPGTMFIPVGLAEAYLRIRAYLAKDQTRTELATSVRGISRTGKTKWTHSESGEIRYQDSQPGEHEGRTEADVSPEAQGHADLLTKLAEEGTEKAKADVSEFLGQLHQQLKAGALDQQHLSGVYQAVVGGAVPKTPLGMVAGIEAELHALVEHHGKAKGEAAAVPEPTAEPPAPASKSKAAKAIPPEVKAGADAVIAKHPDNLAMSHGWIKIKKGTLTPEQQKALESHGGYLHGFYKGAVVIPADKFRELDQILSGGASAQETPAEAAAPEEPHETVAQSLAHADRETKKHDDAMKKEADKLPDGTVVKGWTKVDVAGDKFWKKTDSLGREKFTTFLHKEVGSQAVKDAISQKPQAAPREIAKETEQRAKENYDEFREKYLKAGGGSYKDGHLVSVILNTDDWRTQFPEYKGTNSQEVHEAASYLNKRLLKESIETMRGKGNGRMMILAGGGGSGKGSAVGQFFDQDEYPLRLDQVSDQLESLETKIDDASKSGYGVDFVFVDRAPDAAWGGVVGRALDLRAKGEAARTVPIDIAFESNLAARKTALLLLEKRRDIPVQVIDNTRGEEGGRRLLTKRSEAIEYLKGRIAADEKEVGAGLKSKLIADVQAKANSGAIPGDIARALLGKHFKESESDSGGVSGQQPVSGDNAGRPESTAADADRRAQPGRTARVAGTGQAALSEGAGAAAGVAGEAKGLAKPETGSPGGAALNEEDYTKQAMAGLRKTSRTAGGVVDVSASKGKADKMAGVSGEEAAKLAADNFESTIRQLYRDYGTYKRISADQAANLADGINRQINKGIVKEGVLERTDDSEKFPYTKAKDLPLARRQFAEELAARLNDESADPVETAAWIEWRANLTDHFWADGVGKASKALAAIPLMRAGLPLPNYPDNKEFFAHAAKWSYDPNEGGDAYLDNAWQDFRDYYKTLMPGAKAEESRPAKSTPPAESHERLAAPPKLTAHTLGQQTTIDAAGFDKPLPAHFAVVDLANLKPSHSYATGKPVARQDYPANLQPRDYASGSAEDMKVRDMARRMQVRYHLADVPDASNGPPTITEDGTVLNGNARTMSLELAAQGDRFGEYRDALLKKAQTFGVDPKTIEGLKNPVLVRVVNLDPKSEDAKKFAASGNVAATQSQSPVRTAASLSRLIDDDLIDSLRLDDDTTFSEAVTHPTSGKIFRQQLRTFLPSQEVDRYFTPDGHLTEGGTELVRSMLLSKILPVPLIERMGETHKQLKKTIEASIPQLLKVKRDHPEADVSPQLAEALEFKIRNPAANSPASVDNTLEQGSLFGGKAETLSPGGRMMVDFLNEFGDKPKVTRQKLALFTGELAAKQGLFGAEYPDVPTLAAESLGVPQRENARFGGEPAATPAAIAEEKPDRFAIAAQNRVNQANYKSAAEIDRRIKEVRNLQGLAYENAINDPTRLQSLEAEEKALYEKRKEFEAAQEAATNADLQDDWQGTLFKARFAAQKLGIPFSGLESKGSIVAKVQARLMEMASGKAPTETTTETPSRAPALTLADALAAKFKAGQKIEAKDVWDAANAAYGGTRAEGKYGPSEAYDALEAGFNKSLVGKTNPRADLADAQQQAREIAEHVDQLPTQTNRSGNKDAFQQFSTPPHYAFAVAWLANLKPEDHVLEPSAGTGSLAVHAGNAGAQVTVNELDPKRAEFLRDHFGEPNVHLENAEQIGAILPKKGVQPSVVIMNPPFSQTAGRMGDKKDLLTGAKHIKEAMLTLQPGGRLVAIVGRGMTPTSPTYRQWFDQMGEKYDVAANIGVGGEEYKKYGTHFGTRVLVIDKVAPKANTIIGDAEDIPDLMAKLNGVRNGRPEVTLAASGQPAGSAAAQQSGGIAEPEDTATPPASADIPGEQPASGAGSEQLPAGRGGSSDRVDEGTSGGAGAVPSRGLGDLGAPGAIPPGVGSPEGTPGQPKQKPARTKRAERGAGAGQQPVRQPVPFVSELRPAEQIKVAIAKPQAKAKEGELGDSLYDEYHPALMRIEGMRPHTDKVVESAAMAGIRPPVPTYEPHLSPDLIAGKKINITLPNGEVIQRDAGLSEVALETILYMGQAHQQMLPADDKGVQQRRGMLCGDLPGTGKGRMIAGTILDNWNQGRKKHVWVTQKQGLYADAKRDWADLGGDHNNVVHFDDIRDNPDPPKEGICFITYDTLKGKQAKDPTAPTNLEKLIKWLGPDFDGVIAFDEAHTMGNAMDTHAERDPETGRQIGFGGKDASQSAIAGMELQRQLPQARVGYFSATPATEVRNLGYAERLGIWGPGTDFPNKQAFVDEMTKGGLASMEAVAQSLKATGHLNSRSLSYDGIGYNRLSHTLSDEQKFNYDTMARAWQQILSGMDAVLESLSGGSKKAAGAAKKGAAGQFWGAQQRFFNQVLTSMQMPTIIENMKKDLAENRSPVLFFTNTMDAATKRALANRKEGQEIEELDMSPKQTMSDFLNTSFPIHRWEEYQDEEGNKRTRLVQNADGTPVEDPEAVAKRDELIGMINAMHIIPESPLDQIVDAFGGDKVAEATGRKQRVVWGKDEHGNRKKMIEPRGESSARADIDAFQNGDKKILLLSNKYGTGFSYHSDKNVKNQDQRAFYAAQPGWRADNALQAMGRVNRTNQVNKPVYNLCEVADIPGHKRFVSTIARRLDQLGSLGRGQRQTGSSGIFKAADNLESREAEQALQSLWNDLREEKIEGMPFEQTLRQLGLYKENPEGGRPPVPDAQITRFLNRLLVVSTGMQSRLFDEFDSRLKSIVERAVREGTLDQGVQNYPAEKLAKKEAQVVYKDPASGAETHHVVLTATHKTEKRSWAEVKKQPPQKFVKNERSGRVYAVYQAADKTDPVTGKVTQQMVLRGPGSVQFVNSWETYRAMQLPEDEAKAAWEQEYKELPDTFTEDVNFITGAMLPIWGKIPGEGRVYRVKTEKGNVFAGRYVPKKDVDEMLKNLGAHKEESKEHDLAEVHAKLSNGNGSARLANGWTLKPVRVQGERRIKLGNVGPYYWRQLESQGVIKEKRGSEYEFFVPVGAAGLKVLERITETQPITDVEDTERTLATLPAPVRRSLSTIESLWGKASEAELARVHTSLAHELTTGQVGVLYDQLGLSGEELKAGKVRAILEKVKGV